MISQLSVPGGYPERLLDDYLAVARRRAAGSLATTALRTRSLAARQLLARAAGPVPLTQLLAAAHGAGRASQRCEPSRISAVGLLDLARVIALQDILPDDQKDGLALYELALKLFEPAGIPPAHQGIHAQLALRLGQRARCNELLGIYPDLPDQIRTFLTLDLKNPFSDTAPVDGDSDWLGAFQILFPEPHPILSERPEETPFDRLIGSDAYKVDSTEKVSVIVTTFKPTSGLLTAVRSIIEQSWTDVEVLVVDDGSPSDFDSILKECTELDARIRLIKHSVNAGTYAARNAGMDAAIGEFITFQDSDDWSHPRRLEQQIKPLLADHSLMATVSDALKATEFLEFTQPGRSPLLMNTSSMLFRRKAVMTRIGYFDGVRKSADTEYLKRIEVVFGAKATYRIRGRAYSLIRHQSGSLSNAEFKAGWMHPARDAYRSAYSLWHDQIKKGEADAYLPREPIKASIPAPAHLAISQESAASTQHYDVIFASEWRPFGGPQKSMLEEIAALTKRGLRVAVMQLEAYRFMTIHRKPLCRPIQELINDGTVDRVLDSDKVSTALLLIRYPPVLQFPSATPIRLKADCVLILANQAPAELDGSDVRYVPEACTAIAEALFSVQPRWCPQGPAVRAALEPHLDKSALTDFDMPGIIDIAQWGLQRTGFRSNVPVIGRHSRDNSTKWPESRQDLLLAYPDSPEFDVRIMGGEQSPRKLLGAGNVPSNWLVYGYDEVSVRSFLYQIDFYVYFPHPNMIEAFGRAILEALASGCVVILPTRFEETFGDAAVYCTPHNVQSIIRRYYAEPKLFLEQSRLAQERVRQKFSHDSYFSLVSALIEGNARAITSSGEALA